MKDKKFNIDLVVSESFLNVNLAVSRISKLLKLPSINLGEELGRHLRDNKDETKEILKDLDYEEALGTRLVHQLLSNSDVILSGVNKFLSNESSISRFKETLNSTNYCLSQVWVLRNTNLKHTIGESLTLKGYESFTKEEYSHAHVSAVRRSEEVNDLLKKLKTITIREIEIDSLVELPHDFDQQVLQSRKPEV